MLRKLISKIVREVIDDEFDAKRKQMKSEFDSVLHDVSYRINVMRETANNGGLLRGERRIHTADLNISQHMLDGYVFSNDSPTAGSVSWADLHITYKGNTYDIKDGNTANKYLWWDFDATDNTVLQSSNTKPTLTVDDILIGINDGGTFTVTFTAGKMTHGSTIENGTIGTNELGQGAVDSNVLADSAVTGSKLSDGAVTETKIGDGSITSTKIGSGAVGSNQLASNAVTSAKIASGAVTSTKLGDGSVTSSKLGAGSVAEDKLNVATHFLF